MAVKQHSDLFDVGTEVPQVMASRLGRIAYAAIGFVFLSLGIAGYILPVLPGTVFLLLAAWFFFKSNARMYHWVMEHPSFGPTLRAYHAGYGIRRRIKGYAIVLMWASVGVSAVFAVDSASVRTLLIGLAAIGTWFILSRPTTEDVLAGRA